jgi:oxygen-independent coproporphyrinogen-3 oxidase
MYGLYVHIPFCRRKCNYCDFVSREGTGENYDAYLSTLALEMQQYPGMSLLTAFIGGGTPSILSSAQLDRLFSDIRRIFNCTHLAEMTFESNPESLNDEKLRALKKAGVNRLSIGAQSFADDELAFLGRVHTSRDFERAYAAGRRFGFSNINIDLMYGLPGQALAAWKKNLEKAVAFGPQHLSLYPLTIEPGTAFAGNQVAIDEDLQAEMFEWSIDFMAQEGYEHYEISNWARSGYVCRHNLMYWHNGEYVGVGAAAASHRGLRRWKNRSSIDDYMAGVKSQDNIIEELEDIDHAQRLSEDIILRLRCRSGIVFSQDISERFGGKIEELVGQNLLERVGENIRLTRRGILLANQVMKEFV